MTRPKAVRRFLYILLLMTLMALAAAASVWWWLQAPLSLRGGQALALEVAPGASPPAVAAAVVDAGVATDARWLLLWFRWSGQSRSIKAGQYEITPGTTPRTLLAQLVRGEQRLQAVTLIEGWTFRQVRRALAQAEYLKQETRDMSDADIMAALERADWPAEGRFFPDTYAYAKGSSDLALLRRALLAMERHLEAAWAQRSSETPLQSPDEALILASIIEKETGLPQDRARIAGVFSNRLRIGMLLQTDPTVIYGLGEQYSGTLRRSDLQTDTPWNTYTRTGLPPTPIAMPGKAALLAAVQPEPTQALYFVARGDGSSHFSATLDEHNRAVQRYLRNGNK